MSLPTPSTAEVADNILSQLESKLGQTVPLLPKAFLRVLARVLAAVFVLLWKYAGTIFQNMFVRTASAEPTEINGRIVRPLVEWGTQAGEGEPDAATQAELTLTATVTSAGSDDPIPAGRAFLHAPTGIVYLLKAETEVPGAPGTFELEVVASGGPNETDGSGTIGNLAEGAELSFASPHPRCANIAVVASVDVSGVDAEEVEAYRTRVLRRWQTPPQGGAYADYRLWASEPESIINAYPYTGDPGEVDVYVEAATSIDEDGIAGAPEIAEALAAIELDEEGLATRRPVTAAVNVYSITRSAFDLEIVGLLPDTPETRDAIESAVDEHLRSLDPFIVGLDVMPRRDRVSQMGCAGVVHEIASSRGSSVTSVKLIDTDDQETGGRSLNPGEKAKLGVIEWL